MNLIITITCLHYDVGKYVDNKTENITNMRIKIIIIQSEISNLRHLIFFCSVSDEHVLVHTSEKTEKLKSRNVYHRSEIFKISVTLISDNLLASAVDVNEN